jgi:hypothetical protein
MYQNTQPDFTQAELAYRRDRIQRSIAAGRRRARVGMVQRLRDTVRQRRNPVRGAMRYELDGPATRLPVTGPALDSYRVVAAPHH